MPVLLLALGVVVLVLLAVRALYGLPDQPVSDDDYEFHRAAMREYEERQAA